MFRVTRRIVVEFGPPLVIGLLWPFYGQSGDALPEYIKQFSVAFFMAAWIWNQLQRIIYQQDQISRWAGLGGDLELIKSTMAAMQTSIETINRQSGPELRPAVRELNDLLATATNQIASANSAYSRVKELTDR